MFFPMPLDSPLNVLGKDLMLLIFSSNKQPTTNNQNALHSITNNQQQTTNNRNCKAIPTPPTEIFDFYSTNN
jgi:hypothetical protein